MWALASAGRLPANRVAAHAAWCAAYFEGLSTDELLGYGTSKSRCLCICVPGTCLHASPGCKILLVISVESDCTATCDERSALWCRLSVKSVNVSQVARLFAHAGHTDARLYAACARAALPQLADGSMSTLVGSRLLLLIAANPPHCGPACG